jgi:hypothetical protein
VLGLRAAQPQPIWNQEAQRISYVWPV